MKKYYLSFFAILLGIGLSFGGVPWIFAQEGEFTLEEITVTAEKREANVQDVSMSMAVLSGSDLLDEGATDMFDILKNVTNVIVTETGLGATIAIRGLGQDLPIGVGEGSVSTNFDGAYQMRPEAAQFGHFDIDRVEVLRGPQGTLYGRNATGGVVNIISAKPEMNVINGYVNYEVGDYAKIKGDAAINIPISDTFAARLATVYSKQDAYTKDVSGRRSSQEGYATRLQFRYQPNDDVYINLLNSYVHKTGGLGAAIAAAEWQAGNYDINNSNPASRAGVSKRDDLKFVLNLEFPAGPGLVSFQPSYERLKTESASVATDRATGEVTGVNFSDSEPNETYTAELRYSSTSDSRIIWIGGLYWSKTEEPGTLGGALRSLNIPQYKWYKYSAAFGQMTYPFSDTLRLITGLRYEKDKKGYDCVGLTPQVLSLTFDYVDWKVGIEKDHSDDIMSYFTLATGHRTGGYAEQTGIPFDTESLISAEVGLKSRWLDQRLQFNGSLFYYDYKDYQVADAWFEFDPDTGRDEMMSEFYNVGDVTNFGAELEANYLIGDYTQLILNLAYLNSKYKSDFWPHTTMDPASQQNQKGKALPHSPEITANASIEHTFIFSTGSSLRPKATLRWTDDQYVAVITSPKYIQPSYSVVDASLTFTSTKNWTMNAYSNNVFDKVYANGMGGGGEVYFPGTPRTVGITFNIRF